MHVIVNAGQGRADVNVGGLAICLLPGERLLVSGLPLPRNPALPVVPVAGCGMPRALAHYDHAAGAVRAGDPVALCWKLPVALEDPDAAAAWLIGQLAREGSHHQDGQLERLLCHLARTESYGLVQFLLDEGSDLPVAALAERYGLSSAQFHRRCRQVLGRSLKQELRILRAARALLAYPGRRHSFTYLAADHGYASLSHFCTDIKSLIGRSPLSVYRAVTTPTE